MTGKEDFAARVASYQAGKSANVLGTIHIGAHDDPVLPCHARPQQTVPRPRPSIRSQALALGMGLVSAVLGPLGQFHLMKSQAAPDPTTVTMVTIGAALLAAFALTLAFRLTRQPHRIATLVGLLVGASLFHNLAHRLPGPMAQAFSPAYVQQLARSTPPDSLWFNGSYLPLIPADAPEPAPASEKPDVCPAQTAPVVTVLQTDHARKAPKASHKSVSVAPDPACKPD